MRPPSPNCSTLPEILALQAAATPDAPALLWQNKTLSYQALQTRSHAFAQALNARGQRGDRVAVLSFNCPDFVALIYGVPAAQRVLVPLNARLAPAEWVDQLQRTQCRYLFAEPDLLAKLTQHSSLETELEIIPLDESLAGWLGAFDEGDLPQPQAHDAAWILFTSGSTGRPKGAVLTHNGFMAGLRSAALARPVNPTDRYFYPFPLFHVAAHNVLLQHLYGAAVVLARSFDAQETLDACREVQVTSMSLAPTMIAMLMDHANFDAEDLRTVRTIGYGASAMPSSLLNRLLNETSVGLCQSYGMTELCGSVAFLTADDHRAARHNPELLKSVGKPLPTAMIRIATDARGGIQDQGEILVKAEQCMLGYWQDPTATDAAIIDGWLHTGDIGRFDAAGNLYIVDRKKDMIISGGENIASREIEEAMRQHAAIKDCAVIGLPDKKWGELVCAVVQFYPEFDAGKKTGIENGAERISDSELEAHSKSLLGGYKTPRRWFRAADLPLNAAGKVDKPLLRRRYASSS